MPLTSFYTDIFKGVIQVSGDKSISHRALMISALATGESTITGLLEGNDVLRTATAVRMLGAQVYRIAPRCWRIQGQGVGNLHQPIDVFDMGNSGTGARLLLGLLATHSITGVITGDSSLRTRPMSRVTKPLQHIGARVLSYADGKLPLAIQGTSTPAPLVYRLPVASAQVKSALLLAGLNTKGTTIIIESQPTRDHTERMLRNFGVQLEVNKNSFGEQIISIHGQSELAGQNLTIPADSSSAAFPSVAALLTNKGSIELSHVGVNPLRYGFYQTIQEMGASIKQTSIKTICGEPIANLLIRHKSLTGIDIPATRVPSMIDEYPALAILAACAHGTTCMHGLSELKVKESNRLATIARGLLSCGSPVTIENNTLIIRGNGHPPPGGAYVKTEFDHRIAMAFLVLGMVTPLPVTVDNEQSITTSFPNFVSIMNKTGAHIVRS